MYRRSADITCYISVCYLQLACMERIIYRIYLNLTIPYLQCSEIRLVKFVQAKDSLYTIYKLDSQMFCFECSEF